MMRTIRNTWGTRFWNLVSSVSVRAKIMGIVLGGTLLLSLVLALQARYAMAHTIESELQARGISIGRDLAARATDLILVNDLFALHQLLAETQVNNPDVRYAFVLDPQGQVLAHTFGSGFPADLITINKVDPAAYQHTTTLETNEGLVWDVAVPIFNGEAGYARVGISDQSVNQVLANLTSQILLTTFLVLVLSLLAAAFLTYILTRPILELVRATQALARGDFSHRVNRWANDEIGDLAVAFNQMAAELKRSDDLRMERESLRRQLLDGVIHAQEEERRRIARELHDSTSQNLTSMMVGLHNIEVDCDRSELNDRILELRQTASQVLDDVHNLAVQLRPSILDDLGLSAALEQLIQDWQSRYPIHVEYIVHLNGERLPEVMETTIYRIIQEALTNVVRHSRARTVSILVERRTSDVITIIEDDGIGFDPGSSKGGLGLVGIRERAELMGGHLTIESNPGRGTSLYILIPYLNETRREALVTDFASTVHIEPEVNP